MNNRFFKKNWRFLLTIMVAFIGAVIPVWLAKQGQSGPSLLILLQSQTSLELFNMEELSDLEISIRGLPIKKPFLTIFELKNNSETPIMRKDFEAPIEIHAGPIAKIVRANITRKLPNDLEIDLAWDNQAVRIKPMLLNPKDSIAFSILTSGGQPSFSSKARIVGISSIPIVESTNQEIFIGFESWFIWLLFFTGIFLAIFASVLNNRIDYRNKNQRIISINRGIVDACTYPMFIATGALLGISFLSFGVESLWHRVALIALVMVISFPIAKWLNQDTDRSPRTRLK